MIDYQITKESIRKAIENQTIMGINLVVANNMEILYSDSAGLASVETRTPLTLDTLFPLGSISKVFCAIAVLRYVDRGLLDLNIPVIQYLDNYSFSSEKGNNITLTHLLTHSSGLPQSGKYWGPRDEDALKRYMYEELCTHKFIAEPGELLEYSNTAICLAGHILEAISGKYYDDIVQEEVFDPLGMNVTYDPVIAMTYPIALPHNLKDNEVKVFHKMPRNHAGNPSSFSYGTVHDLVTLAQVILNNGKYKGDIFLSEKSINLLKTPVISRRAEFHNHPWATLYKGNTIGLNYGNYRNKYCIRHGGVNLSNDCRFDIFPDNNLIVISMVNWYSGTDLTKIILDLFDEILQPDKNVPRYDEPPQLVDVYNPKLIGKYHHKSSGMYFEIKLYQEEKKLFIVDGSREMELFAKSDYEWYYLLDIDGEKIVVPVILEILEKGKYVFRGGMPFVQVSNIDSPSTNELIQFTGRYKDSNNYNEDDVIEVKFDKDHKFVIKEVGENEYKPIMKVGRNEYTSHLGALQFLEDENTKNLLLQLGYSVKMFKISS